MTFLNIFYSFEYLTVFLINVSIRGFFQKHLKNNPKLLNGIVLKNPPNEKYVWYLGMIKYGSAVQICQYGI